MSNVLKNETFQLSADLTFFPFSEGGVVFRTKTRKVWALNHAAAIIWCLIEQVDNRDQLISKLEADFGVSGNKAREDVETTLQMFYQQGLFGGKDKREKKDEDNIKEEPVTKVEIDLPSSLISKRNYTTPNHIFEIYSSDERIASEYDNAMRHFAVDRLDLLPDTRLWVLDSDEKGLMNVYLDRACYQKNLKEDDILLTLLFLTFSHVSASLANKLLFHAAVLEKNGKAFVFPASAGSGKTTLSAFLAKRGYNFFADELAVVDRENNFVSPLPLPMSIKKGSIEVLRNLYPELSTLRSFIRTDGKEVKILPPDCDKKIDCNLQVPIQAIIFPKYGSENKKTSLVELTKSEAISRLVATCSSDRPLIKSDIKGLIGLVDNHPCYSLTYSDLKEVLISANQERS